MFRHVLYLLFIPHSLANCPIGSVQGLLSGDCYTYGEPLNWLDAEEDCANRGGSLVFVDNAFGNALLPILPRKTCASPYSASEHSYWLGGSVGLSSNRWSWNDGTSLTYTSWANGQPTTVKPQCLALGVLDSRWYGSNCSDVKPYVCKVPSTVTETCPQCPANSCATNKPVMLPTCAPSQPRCPSGWTFYEPSNKCFKLIYSTNFYDARFACQLMKSTLASVHSSDENTFLSDFSSLRYPTHGPEPWSNTAWIGLYDPQHNGSWLWTDGTKVDYSRWYNLNWTEPNGSGPCGKIDSDDSGMAGYWDDYFCTEAVRAAICQIRLDQ